MTLKEEIERQLDRLPPEQQKEVLAFTEALTIKTTKKFKKADLHRFFGVMNSEEAKFMIKAIEDNF